MKNLSGIFKLSKNPKKFRNKTNSKL